MRYFIYKKGVSNFDLRPAVEAVINIEKSDSNKPNTMELNKFVGAPQFYEIVTPTGSSDSFSAYFSLRWLEISEIFFIGP